MATFLKILNIILIALLVYVTGALSALFFLGSPETYNQLSENIIVSFTKRCGGFMILGFLGACTIYLLNYLLMKTVKSYRPGLKKIFVTTIILTSIASIIGTIFFFF